MINPLILLFNVLESSKILSVHTIISNFLLLLICRGFFIIIYALNYYQGYDKEWGEEEQLSTRNYFIQFALKQVILILLGSLFFPLAVGISFYSLSMTGSYIKQIGLKNELKNAYTFGTLFSLSLPIIGIIWFVFNEESLAIAAIGISLMVFFYYGQNSTTLTLLEVIERNQRRYSRFPKYLSIGFFILLLIVPTIIIVFTVIYDTPSVRTYDVIMRDGIKLATDVYIAPGSFGGPRPVILIRTPYGKSGTGAALSTLYLLQGYHAVVQDLRGTFDSEDHETFLMFFNDYMDGVDTINWILNQSWCNGKIATVGLSALTINSFFFAGMNPDGLVTQSLMVGTPDVYDTVYQGGALRESMITGWLKETADNYDYQITQYKEHLMKDNFYAPVSLFMEDGPNIQNIDIPAIHVAGWYDCFQQHTLDGYMGYNALGQEGARGKQLLIIGPFTHGFPGEGKHGKVIFPTKSTSAFTLYLDWEQKLFSHAFYGTEFDWNENRVAYYMMGDMNDSSEGVNDYRYAKEWPIEPYADDSWYLTANMGLSKDSPGSINTNVSYVFDPTNPVPTLGGTNLIITSGPYDQSSIENRTDVLIFETSRLTEKIEVIGHIFAHLWVMSNCTNTDFTVKITDVYPDGKSMLVSDGIINAIKRDGYDKDAAPLNTVGPLPLTIDLWSTAYQFNIGHRIRIAISSSNYPRFAINPNTGAPQEIYSYQYLDRFIANNTILVGPDFPSAIILPRLLET